MITKFYNANLVGFNNNVIKNGCLIAENNNIIYVGNDYSKSVDCSIDVGGLVLMPAPTNMLVNVNGNFNNVLNALIKNGVTNCVFNGVLNKENLEQAKQTINCFGVTINVNKLEEVTKESLTEQFNKILPYGIPVIYIENLLNLTEPEIERIYLFCKNNNANLMVTVNESLEQVGVCHNETKQTPIELVESYGLFDLKLTLLKCQSVDKYDLDILAKYKANVVITPVKDLMLGDGITPVASFVEHDVKVSVASLNYNDNFLNVLRLIKLTQSGYLNNKNAINSYNLINMVTNNNLFNNNGLIVVDFGEPFDLDKFILSENKVIKQLYINGKQIL